MFGFDEGLVGVFLVVEREPLTPECRTFEEVRASITDLKAELDRVGLAMEAALKDMPLQARAA